VAQNSPLMERESSVLLFTVVSPQLTILSTVTEFIRPGSRMKYRICHAIQQVLA
jgi:hypothetical protein